MSSAATKHKPDHAVWKCVTCNKAHDNPSGYCSTWCKEQAQIRGLGARISDLPIVRRVPRIVPERLK